MNIELDATALAELIIAAVTVGGAIIGAAVMNRVTATQVKLHAERLEKEIDRFDKDHDLLTRHDEQIKTNDDEVEKLRKSVQGQGNFLNKVAGRIGTIEAWGSQRGLRIKHERERTSRPSLEEPTSNDPNSDDD